MKNFLVIFLKIIFSLLLQLSSGLGNMENETKQNHEAIILFEDIQSDNLSWLYTEHLSCVCSSHRARIMVLWLSYNFLLCNFGLFTLVSLLISFISHDFYDLTLNKNLLQNKTKHTIWQKLTQNKAWKKILRYINSKLSCVLQNSTKIW